jgi:hypothetical protein
MIDPEELPEVLMESEARIGRQIRLVAELEGSGRVREARLARELLSAITECHDLRSMGLRRRDTARLRAWVPPDPPRPDPGLTGLASG